MKEIYLIGLGAIGAMVAAKLQDAGKCSLKVIVDSARRERYTREGIFVNNKKYAFSYISPDEKSMPADLVIVSVKNYNLKEAIEGMRPFIGKNTSIMSLLNGIDSETVIGREFGMDKMLYSFHVATDAVRIGNNIRYTNIGRIVFGEKGSPSQRVTALRLLLESSGIPCIVPEDILRELWWKFMMNVGINQTSAILKAPYGVYQKSETARSLMRDACLEVVRIAEKLGINIKESDIDQYEDIIKSLSPELKTSMLQDVEAFRKTEVEAFSGTIVRLGGKYGVETPVNQVLYKMLKVIENNYPVSRTD